MSKRERIYEEQEIELSEDNVKSALATLLYAFGRIPHSKDITKITLKDISPEGIWKIGVQTKKGVSIRKENVA